MKSIKINFVNIEATDYYEEEKLTVIDSWNSEYIPDTNEFVILKDNKRYVIDRLCWLGPYEINLFVS